MKSNNMNKYMKKLVIFTLSIFLFVGVVNVKAGYTYDSKGEPIYSTEGFTVNELPYTYSGLNIGALKNADLDKFIEITTAKSDAKALEISDLSTQVSEKNAAILANKYGLVDDYDTKIRNTDHDEMIAYLKAQIAAAEKESPKDEAKIEELNKKLASTEEAKAALKEADIKKNKEAAAKLKDEKALVVAEIDALSAAEKEQLKSELKTLREAKAVLDSELAVLQAEKKVLDDRNTVLETRKVNISKASPSDLYIFNIEDEDDENILIPQEMYLTDSGMNLVSVLNTDFQVVKELHKFRLDEDKLKVPNFSAIKTQDDSGKKGVLIETNASSQKFYNENGYYELDLFAPTAAYRSITKTLDVTTGTLEYIDLLYICDKGNNQVVILKLNDPEYYDANTGLYVVYQVLTKPTDELDSTKEFAPQKIVTDDKRRMYVIADNITQGIMQFSEEGKFQRYTGKNDITLSAWEIFWRNLASESQLDSQSSNYNTSFNSMVYSDAMIYTTSLAITNADGTINDKIMIKRINPSGGDTLARNGYKVPMGDVKYSNTTDRDDSEKGPSQLVGITVNGYQVYSVVDKSRGRIFTYDKEGNLLYISGGNDGTQADKLNGPVSIQYFGEDILVLDQLNKTIVKFEPTEIATLINEAVKLDNVGRRSTIEPTFSPKTGTWWIDKVDTGIKNKGATYEYKNVDGKDIWFIDNQNTNVEVQKGSTYYWEKVVALNANYEYGYVGIGHRYLEEENFEEAMRYFELGKNRVYYSKAYKQYRDGIIRQWFTPVLVTVVVLIAGSYAYKTIKNKKLGIKKEEETGVGDE